MPNEPLTPAPTAQSTDRRYVLVVTGMLVGPLNLALLLTTNQVAVAIIDFLAFQATTGTWSGARCSSPAEREGPDPRRRQSSHPPNPKPKQNRGTTRTCAPGGPAASPPRGSPVHVSTSTPASTLPVHTTSSFVGSAAALGAHTT
jgi:hypothetical protein